jgi:hypothetical protein
MSGPLPIRKQPQSSYGPIYTNLGIVGLYTRPKFGLATLIFSISSELFKMFPLIL